MSDRTFDDGAQALAELRDVLNSLLGPDGCPWDKDQTPVSLCDYLAEETFELIEGIRAGDTRETMEEMGDVLFILLFMNTLYEKNGDFSISDALRHSADKMVRRHPHVFGEKRFDNQEQLWDNWEKTKKKEKESEGRKRVYDSLPKGLPPLLRSYRINSKAARNGFTWNSDEEVQRQYESEWDEWQQALASGDPDASEKEFGDLLFTLVELGRRKGIKANAALDFANQKFLRRFAKMEKMAEAHGQSLDDMDLDAMNRLWDKAKQSE